MDHPHHNTELRKNKHLNYKERMTIQLRLRDGYSAYKISKELHRPINTILNEIRRGTTTQIKKRKHIEIYLADTDKVIYTKNRLNSCRSFKHLQCDEFIKYTVNQIKSNSWSPDACVGSSLLTGKFKHSEIVCTKTIYNYIDLGLLSIKNADLSLKLRRSTKPTIVKKA